MADRDALPAFPLKKPASSRAKLPAQATALDFDSRSLRVVMPGLSRVAVAPVNLPADADRTDPAVLGAALAKALEQLRLKPGPVVMGLPRAQVVPGTAYVAGQIEAPGVIRYTSEMSSISFGPGEAATAKQVSAFRDACIAAGFGATIDPNIDVLLWTKFVILAPNASLTALSRQPAGLVYHDPRFLALATDAIGEVVAVARACGVALPHDIVDRGLKIVRAFPPDMYASMYRDLARGRRLEVEEIQGTLIRIADKHGVPVPIHCTAYCCLKPFAAGTER